MVILNKEPYIEKMTDIVTDTTKFELITQPIDSYTRQAEDKINHFLLKLKNMKLLSPDTYKRLYASGTGPGILYGLPKIHKTNFANNFKFRPIFAAYNTPSYELAKFLVPILSPLTTNEYTVDNSSKFVDEITRIPDADKLYMASFDVESLFTNIPLMSKTETENSERNYWHMHK